MNANGVQADVAKPIANRLTMFSNSCLVISFVCISQELFLNYHKGGDPWKQGDWLINNGGGFVRRGIFGSSIIQISDILRCDLLLAVLALQLSFVAILFLCFHKITTQIRDPYTAILLFLSSAMPTVFWLFDHQGSVRKELITFVALMLCALGSLQERRLLFWLGIIFMSISFISHEALILFVPTFLGILILSGFIGSHTKTAVWGTVVVCLSAVCSIFIAVEHSQTGDLKLVCAQLIERGLDSIMCSGAIRWVALDQLRGTKLVLARATFQNVFQFIIAYAIALLPYVYLTRASRRPLLGLAVLAATALPFLPLYFIAIDWGRWMSFHIFSVAIIAACAAAKQDFFVVQQRMNAGVLAIIAIPLLITPHHVIGIQNHFAPVQRLVDKFTVKVGSLSLLRSPGLQPFRPANPS